MEAQGHSYLDQTDSRILNMFSAETCSFIFSCLLSTMIRLLPLHMKTPKGPGPELTCIYKDGHVKVMLTSCSLRSLVKITFVWKQNKNLIEVCATFLFVSQSHHTSKTSTWWWQKCHKILRIQYITNQRLFTVLACSFFTKICEHINISWLSCLLCICDVDK